MERNLFSFAVMTRWFEDNGLQNRHPIQARLSLPKATPSFPLVYPWCHIPSTAASTPLRIPSQSPQMTPLKWGDGQNVLGRLKVHPAGKLDIHRAIKTTSKLPYFRHARSGILMLLKGSDMEVARMRTLETSSQPPSQSSRKRESPGPLNPGIILLSSGHELLYITPTALQILRHIDDSLPSPDRLPPIIRDLCGTIENARRHCSSPTEWATVQIHRMTLMTHHRIALSGFIIPEWNTPPSHRLLIVLEILVAEISSHGTNTTPASPLTARQESVARGLMRGLTNKEMATELCLSTHTIKEYVRAIMTKVKATTRAGVVARLVGAPQSVNKAEGSIPPDHHPTLHT